MSQKGGGRKKKTNNIFLALSEFFFFKIIFFTACIGFTRRSKRLLHYDQLTKITLGIKAGVTCTLTVTLLKWNVKHHQILYCSLKHYQTSKLYPVYFLCYKTDAMEKN